MLSRSDRRAAMRAVSSPWWHAATLMLASLLGLASSPAASAGDRVTAILPQEALLWVRTESWSVARQNAERVALMKFLRSDAMTAIRDQMQGEMTPFLLEQYGLDLALLDRFTGGEVVAVGSETDAGLPTIAVFVETKDEAAAAELRSQSERLLLDHGARKRTGASEQEDVAVFDVDNNDAPLLLAGLDEYVLFAGDVGAGKRLIDRWQADSVDDPLAEAADFQASRAALSAPGAPKIDWFLRPIAFAVAAERAAKAAAEVTGEPILADDGTGRTEAVGGTDNGETPRLPYALRHGFPGLKAIAGQTWVNDLTEGFQSEVVLYAPGPQEQAMRMFNFPAGSTAFPDFIPVEAASARVVRWNLEQMIANVGDLYDDFVDAPGAFEGTMRDYRKELNVDLPGELFPRLGPEIASFSNDDPNLDVEATIIAVEIKDPARNEREVAKMIYQLLRPEGRRLRVPGRRYGLWELELAVGNQQAAFSKAGITVADGRLWIATHRQALSRLLLSKSEPLAGHPIDIRFREAIAPHVSDQTFAVSLAHMDRDARPTYEILRAEGLAGLEDVESTYAMLLKAMLEEDNSGMAFDRLPPFEVAKRYLNELAIAASNLEDGWKIFLSVYPKTPPQP